MSIPRSAAAHRSVVKSIAVASSPSSRQASLASSRSSHVCPRTRHFSSSQMTFAALYTRPTSKTASTTTSSKPNIVPTAASTVTSSSPKAPATPAAKSTAQPQSSPTLASSSKSTSPSSPTPRSLARGLDDLPPPAEGSSQQQQTPLPDADPSSSFAGQPVDWSRSFHGLSATPFSKEAADALLTPINPEDVEIKPDGIIYLPEIKYRRILNRAFGPGGWGLAPRGETIVTGKSVTREYGLVAHGRLVSIARGEQAYFDPEGIPTATEGCKSNALMRCCKDLGIASELWDPVFIRKFKAEWSKEIWVEQLSNKKKRKISMRKDVSAIPGGYKAV